MSSPVRILLAVLSVMAATLPSSRSLSFNITNFSDHPALAVCPRNASGGTITLMGDAGVGPLGFLCWSRRLQWSAHPPIKIGPGQRVPCSRNRNKRSSPEMPQPVGILLAILSVMAAILPSSRSLSFNITNFSGYPAFAVCPKNASGDVISVMGDAHIEPIGFLQLTTDSSQTSRGRAYICERLHLWNRATGAVTNFTTTFSFDFDVQYAATYGEKSGGMTFYLSPVGWPFQPNSYGNSLGLGNDTYFPGVVAVEFDSVGNDTTLDPRFTDGSHIGIDNGNLQSLVTEEIGPLNSFTSGAIGEAVVSYDSAATKLSVSLRFNGSLYEISSVLDLTSVLPEWVSVGFSASTGGSYDMKRIRSWSFESSLDAAPKQQEKNTTAAADSPAAAASDPGNNTEAKKWKVVAVVFIVIAACLLVLSSGLAFCLWKRKRKEGSGNPSQINNDSNNLPVLHPNPSD